MSPPIHRDRNAVRFWLGLAALGCGFVGIAAASAQAPPVITNPGDLRFISANTSFAPGAPNPTWRIKAPMPTARAAFATAAVNDKIYAIGGAILNDCVIVPTVEAYEPSSDSWNTRELAPMPPPLRFRPSGAALDNLIYVVGGGVNTPEKGCSNVALGTVQAYDPAKDKWSTKLSSLNMPRIQVGLGADNVNHLLYAVGGSSSPPDDFVLHTVEVYDPGTGTWEYKQDLNTPRGAPAVAAVNGKIYAIGGQTQNQGVIDSVEEFDPSTNEWTTKPSVMPHPRLNSTAAVVDGKIYVLGGEFDGIIISTVDVYDPSSDTWTTETEAPLPTARRFAGAAVVDNTIYTVGGEALVATVGQPFTYQITATNSPTSYLASPLPAGLSINRQRGIIFGTPTTTARGFVVAFTATNESGSDSKDVSLYIGPPPLPLPELESIVSSTCATGRAGQPFAFQVLTNYASTESKLAATGLPYEEGVGPQMTIDPGTGLISGIVPPTTDGSSQSFGVQLNSTNGDPAQSFLQLTFVSNPNSPVISSSSNVSLVLNKFFSYTITADAPTASLDFIGLNGELDTSLPSGLSFDPETGTISGLYTGEAAPYDALAGSARARQEAEGDSLTQRREEIETIKKEPPPKIQLLVLGEDDNGTGTAPLNFFASLHDFETEALMTQSSTGINYVIFTDDPLTSGGAAGLLKSTKVGDYVTYTVPFYASGTYDVKVGIRTRDNQGIFQLVIDGVNHGSPQDEYSPTIGYEVRDLGPFTFTTDGPKTFQFVAVDRNPLSRDFELIFDYLDLDPYFEAETLPIQAQSAPKVRIYGQDLSGGAAMLLKATQIGDYVTYGVPIAVAGNYSVRVRTNTGSNTGIFQLFIDGVKQGYAQKGHESGSNHDFNLRDLGTVSFDTAGEKAFQFVVTGGNSSSTKYNLAFDYIELVLTSRFEAEELPADSTGRLTRVDDDNLAGGAGILFEAKAPGDFVTYDVTVPSAGTYNVKVGIRKDNRGGIVQLAIDGVDQGSAQDNYAAEADYEVIDLGKVTFTEAGERTFQFLVTGHNPASQGYQFVLDYIDLGR
jgi:N-acetylneuraminic acid mutarotase